MLQVFNNEVIVAMRVFGLNINSTSLTEKFDYISPMEASTLTTTSCVSSSICAEKWDPNKFTMSLDSFGRRRYLLDILPNPLLCATQQGCLF